MATSRQQALRMEIFNLALFLHPNITEAQAVTLNAWEKYDKADDLRYRRTKNAKKEKSYRAELSDRQLAQQMVYEASEQFLANTTELQEFAAPAFAWQGNGHPTELAVASAPSLETAIIHFLKFLALITTRRNALYVAVGFCQLLRSFSTDEAALILETLKPEDWRTWLESQCRNIKSKLTKELRARFDFPLSTGAHGALHFAALPNADEYRSLVLECLTRFVPWGTSHVNQDLAPLASEVEIFHALLEPACFTTVLARLHLKHNLHFELPCFTGTSWPGGSGSSSGPASGQGPTEPHLIGMNKQPFDDPHRLEAQLNEELRKRAAARTQLTPEFVRIFVNGKFVARLDLQAQPELTLEIDESDRLLEVYAPSAQGDVLLATLPIACDEAGGIAAVHATTRKIKGFRFSFAISPFATDVEPGNTRAKVVVTYHSPLWPQGRHWLSSWFTGWRVLRPSLGLVAMLLIAALLWNLVKVPVTAASLVQKSISVEQETLAKDFREQWVAERKLRLEVSRPGDHREPQTYYITTWNEAQRSVRLLARDKAQKNAISGEWRQADGAISLYSKPGAKRQPPREAAPTSPEEVTWPIIKPGLVAPMTNQTPLSQPALSTTGVEVWRLSPDAADFQTIIGAMEHAIATETPTGWELRYLNPEPTKQPILSAALTLNRAYHAVRLSVTLREGEGTREFRFTEESWEKRPRPAVEKVFTPNRDWIADATLPKERISTPPASVGATPAMTPQNPRATVEEEIEVRAKLNQIGADLGQEVEVEWDPNQQLFVHAVVASKARKEQILQALASFQNNPAIRIRIETKAERSSGGASGPAPEVPSALAGGDAEMVRKLSRNVLKTSEALHKFYDGKSSQELAALSPATRKKLLTIAVEQSRKYDSQATQLMETLRLSVVPPPPGGPVEISSLSELQMAVGKLSALTLKIDQEIAAFPDEAVSPAARAQVAKLLGQARLLAQRIRQAAENLD